MAGDGIEELPDFTAYLKEGEGSESMADMLREALANDGDGEDERRGLVVTPTDADREALQELEARLLPPTGDASGFRLDERPRCHLFMGEVSKKGTESLLKRTTRRQLVLLNDALLVCDAKKPETTVLKQVVQLRKAMAEDMRWDTVDTSPFTFAIITPERRFHFMCGNEEDLEHWLRELKLAIYAIRRQALLAQEICGTYEAMRNICWEHEAFRGTIWSAALLGNAKALSALLAKEDDVDVRDETGRSPLHFAAFGGNTSGMKLLLDRGADVNAFCDSLDTPLHYAAGNLQEESLRVLLEAGADLDLRNMDDRTPLFVSILCCEQSAAAQRILSLLKMSGADMNEADTSGETGLHVCARQGFPRVTQLLASLGADPNAPRHQDGRTPLHIAASVLSPDPETLRALLHAGARPNVRDGQGKDALRIVLSEEREADIAKQAAMRIAAETAEANGDSPASPTGAMARVSLERGESDASMSSGPAEAVSEEWVMSMIQPLLELVKHGARPSERLVPTLPDMTREILEAGREQWMDLEAPEDLSTHLPNLMPKVPQDEWVSDSALEHCQLCHVKFGFTTRRHHCRFCGALACGECTQKRVALRGDDPSSAPSEKRVCDASFNEILGRYERATQQGANVMQLQKRLEAENVRRLMATGNTQADEANLERLLKKHEDDQAEGELAQAGKVQGTMAQNMMLLDERGRKLEHMSDKTADLASSAQEFQSLTKQLRKQSEQQSRRWPF